MAVRRPRNVRTGWIFFAGCASCGRSRSAGIGRQPPQTPRPSRSRRPLGRLLTRLAAQRPRTGARTRRQGTPQARRFPREGHRPGVRDRNGHLRSRLALGPSRSIGQHGRGDHPRRSPPQHADSFFGPALRSIGDRSALGYGTIKAATSSGHVLRLPSFAEEKSV